MTADDLNDWESRMAACWGELRTVEPALFVQRIDDLAAERGDDAAATFERAAARDSTGREAEAEVLYRRALEDGLDPYRRTRATIQLASTLRILGRLAESESLLLAERARGDPVADAPLRDELHAILALTWIAQGRAIEAAALALATLAPHLSRYQRSVAGNAKDILASFESR